MRVLYVVNYLHISMSHAGLIALEVIHTSALLRYISQQVATPRVDNVSLDLNTMLCKHVLLRLVTRKKVMRLCRAARVLYSSASRIGQERGT